MNFPLNAYLAAWFGAFFVSLLSLPYWRKLCRRCGLVDDPGGRKIHEQPMALAGGFAVLTGIALPILLGVVTLKAGLLNPRLGENLLSHGLAVRGMELGVLVLGAFGMFGLGVLDDRRELSPALKFTGQLLIALFVALAGVRITLFVHNLAFSYGVTVLWILTLTNAFNFMDNMNGLCAGLGAITAGVFAIIAAVDGQYLAAIPALLACGALAGFLPHNFPRASAFLGDAGSHLVGYLLAVMAILPHYYSQHHQRVLAVFAPVLALAVPLGDLVWVVLIRWRLGKPFYIGDNNHLSHRLVRAGCNRTRAVLIIWLWAAVTGGLALLFAF